MSGVSTPSGLTWTLPDAKTVEIRVGGSGSTFYPVGKYLIVRLTEGQTRLARETAEFEDAKRFYARKLSKLRDRVQDQSIHFWQYEKRMKEMERLYERDTGQTLPEWKNAPNVRYDIEEARRSVSVNARGNQSMSVGSVGWVNLSDFASNVRSGAEVLLDEEKMSSGK